MSRWCDFYCTCRIPQKRIESIQGDWLEESSRTPGSEHLRKWNLRKRSWDIQKLSLFDCVSEFGVRKILGSQFGTRQVNSLHACSSFITPRYLKHPRQLPHAKLNT